MVKLDNCTDHAPDGSFHYDGLTYPPVVFEVSYEQRVKDLKNLARDYILESNANIRIVIGVDFGQHYECATLSVWRAAIRNVGGSMKLCAQRIVDQEVCSL